MKHLAFIVAVLSALAAYEAAAQTTGYPVNGRVVAPGTGRGGGAHREPVVKVGTAR